MPTLLPTLKAHPTLRRLTRALDLAVVAVLLTAFV